jgi:hypothetical protein
MGPAINCQLFSARVASASCNSNVIGNDLTPLTLYDPVGF